jgi:hypothetical protein
MRAASCLSIVVVCLTAAAADVESRRLTHYVPQDLLEAAVRHEGWTEIPLAVKGGVLKGDRVRVWAGGSIDRGNGDQPGQNINPPAGVDPHEVTAAPVSFALSPEPGHGYAILFKTEGPGLKKCLPAGKPLEITMTKDKERLWVGFNDERGRFQDNHIGRGRRHELDPCWLRIEVVRTIVD